ncbi:MAG: hypothetical protein MJ236_05405 [Clostridia bacterium]|nr:hypothetical protein [Clostridia bacterium]
MMEEKNKNVTQIILEVVEEMCDKYCKYSDQAKANDDLWTEHCDNCPLNKL